MKIVYLSVPRKRKWVGVGVDGDVGPGKETKERRDSKRGPRRVALAHPSQELRGHLEIAPTRRHESPRTLALCLPVVRWGRPWGDIPPQGAGTGEKAPESQPL